MTLCSTSSGKKRRSVSRARASEKTGAKAVSREGRAERAVVAAAVDLHGPRRSFEGVFRGRKFSKQKFVGGEKWCSFGKLFFVRL